MPDYIPIHHVMHVEYGNKALLLLLLISLSITNTETSLTIGSVSGGWVHEGHGVEVEVEEAVEREELGWVLVVGRHLRHQVILELTDAEAKHHDCDTYRQHNQHERRHELESQICGAEINTIRNDLLDSLHLIDSLELLSSI